LNPFGDDVRIGIVKGLPCLIALKTGCVCKTPSDNAHVKSRKAGGDKESIVPLCRLHHNELHNIGKLTFQAKYSIDLDEEAAKLSAILDNN